MRHGKGHPATWNEIRRVVTAAIDDALETTPLDRLLQRIAPLCRDAAFKARRNKRDKSAQLKMAYYNMVTDFLEEGKRGRGAAIGDDAEIS